jgi:hypothetical protein
LRERPHDLSLGESKVEPGEDDLCSREVDESIDVEAPVISGPERRQGGEGLAVRSAVIGSRISSGDEFAITTRKDHDSQDGAPSSSLQ